ncbi:MAG: hypothetical protein WCQ61_07495 [Proteiniphilum sp.]
MNSKIPKIKKNINDFLIQEEGSIDKKKAINMGISALILGSAFYGTTIEAHNSFLLNNSDFGQHFSSDGTSAASYHTSNLINITDHGEHSSHTSVPWNDWSDEPWNDWSDEPWNDWSDEPDPEPWSDEPDPEPWSDEPDPEPPDCSSGCISEAPDPEPWSDEPGFWDWVPWIDWGPFPW